MIPAGTSASREGDSPGAPGRSPRFSVIVPSLGAGPGLGLVLDALSRQTISPEQFEVIVVLDGSALADEARTGLAARGVRLERLERRAGPGSARNRGAQQARGEILAFTEDDCRPDPDWLAHAARRFDEEPGLDALDGLTEKPGGRPVRIQPGGDPLYLPTNLFVRRTTFARVGGYCEGFYEPDGAIYFREDSDLGFSLEAAGARVVRDRTVRVEHPEEHPRFLDPLRWARRYLMDPLLARRHPERFRARIEVLALGPLRIRRPFVRACTFYAIGLILLAAGLGVRAPRLAAFGGGLAAAALIAVWSKWRFDPRRLPLVPLVPLVLLDALARGAMRARRLAPAVIAPRVSAR
jgi:glycosyltransferase involved in cell wall biosynthesis